MKCKNCGKDLPDNSKFCKYCGSKDLDDSKEEKVYKELICYDCGKELPADSVFCQYCGSKNIGEKKTETKIDKPTNDTNENADVVEPKIKQNSESTQHTIKSTSSSQSNAKSYKTVFIVACIIACILGIGWVSTCSNQTSLQNKISDLEKKVSTAETKAKTAESKVKTAESNAINYKAKASKYDTVDDLANQTIYSDFRSDTYFVKGTSKTVTIYCNFNYYGEYTLNSSVSGSGVNLSWGNWSSSGTSIPMYVTCTSSGYGIITLTNTVNNHKIKIFVTGS